MQIKRLKQSSFTDLVCSPILPGKYYNHDFVHNTRCAIKMEIKTESFVIGSSFLPSATKLRQGNVFTPVCQSFRSQGGGLPQCMLGYTHPQVDTPMQTPPPG